MGKIKSYYMDEQGNIDYKCDSDNEYLFDEAEFERMYAEYMYEQQYSYMGDSICHKKSINVKKV